MDKYEISLWEDYPDLTSNNIPFLNERKICVIGSDTMTSAARALEPKLVSNVNGTNTFSFRIYYRYKDEITGEENINPYLPYIINERKVKVLWKDKWYDLVIKKMEEDTQKRSVLCTCEDLFISELSRNGYELEFSSELQNNSGTASELVEKVLDGSGWQPAAEQQSIIQYQEEPVYEVYTRNSVAVIKQSPNGNTSATISANKLCLLYQSCIDESCINIQFLYDTSNYITEENGMLVLNGDCYTFSGQVSYSGDQAIIKNSNGTTIFQFTISDAFSSNYRAKRLVGAQLTAFDELLGRYVDVYENDIYGYETTEYSDPTLVVNLIANPKDFKDTQGWIGNNLKWQVYPEFTGQNNQTVANYNAKSYLKISKGNTYNTAFVSNRQYLVPNSTDVKNGKLGGFQVGEKYVFRYKAKSSLSSNSYITSGITCWAYKFSIDSSGNYGPIGSSYFSGSSATVNNGWTEIILTCSKACTANDLNSVGLFIHSNSTYYIEDIQFFKLAYGTDIETFSSKRINPGDFSAQSIAKTVYRYYNADHDGVTDAEDLKFLYSGETKQSNYIPKYNNYEKISSIEESKSNRFNILQSIAEKFECWVRFVINHNQETGQVLYDSNGLPQKYVQLVEQIGQDTGISFEYGIDLKGIKRTVISNTIASKAIIIPNENEFGKNGFCTIARSPLNYCRDNFILNFDYYIQQGLLNKNTIEDDLYKTNQNHLGYYFYLNRWNREYDELAEIINIKQIELIKQKAEYKVQSDNYRATLEKLDANKADLMLLAGVDTFASAQNYAKNHSTNRKVQSLMGSIAQLNNNIENFEDIISGLELSISNLEAYITNKTSRMNTLIEYINNKHKAFFKKYSRFIQEGTWQDQNYVDDDKYYLDALEVAYRSSRPQIQYDISLLRLSGLENFSSKIFDLGDICYVQDKEFFGYEEDGITPYKQKIIISQLTSYFDTPEKDIIKVQNYKTQFDDLFQRITTATQALQFSQGKYERVAGVVKPDKTLSFALLQDTFNYNKDLVLNSANQEVVWDNTGITVSDSTNSALKVKIMAGGIFASDDGGATWKNALRGNGISTDLLTAGRINTSEIYVYDGINPSFRWDSQGINAYDTTSYSKFVRFDKFGIYGYSGTSDFMPEEEDTIWNNSDTKFGLTWKGFFLRNSSGNSSIEISTDNDILIKTGNTKRIQIGKYGNKYGMFINDENNKPVFSVNTTNNINSIGGWTLTKDSFSHTANGSTIGLYSSGQSATVQNNTDYYYILAGSNFGVTIDGSVYANAGKIGGCEIINGKLIIGSTNVDSTIAKAADANNQEQIIYYSSDGGVSIGKKTDEWVTDNTGKQNRWTNVRPEYNRNYPVLYTAIQRKMVDGTITCTQPKVDATTTVIDGAHIITGTIDANKIAVQDLSAFNATIGGFTIGQTAIYSNGKNSYNSTRSGVYIGTDGISLGDNFRVDSSGNLYANTGTFAGNIYAGNIQYGGNYGTLPGAGISQYSISDDRISNGTISTSSLNTGVNNSLGYANNFNNATTQNSGKYPAYFCASQIVALSSFYSDKFLVSTGNDSTEYDLAGHYHSLTESGGRIVLGIPHNNAAIAYHSFKIADTATYKAGVSAAKQAVDISSVASTINSGEWDKSVTIAKARTSYPDNYLYGYINVKLSNDKTKTVQIAMHGGLAYQAGKDSVSPASITIVRETSDNNIVWDADDKTVGASYTITVRNSSGTVIYTEREYPIIIPATKAYNTGAASVTPASSVTISSVKDVYIPEWNERDYTVEIAKKKTEYYPSQDTGWLYGAINVKLSNDKTYSVYIEIDASDVYNQGYADGGGGGGSSDSHNPSLRSGGNAGSAYYVGDNEYFQPIYVIPVCDGVEGESEILYYYHSP